MNKLRFLACLIALGVPFSPACKKVNAQEVTAAAPESKLPSGESIFNKFIEATGGIEAQKKIKNTTGKGTFEISGMGIKGGLAIYGAEPNLALIEMEIPGMGKMSEGCDGKIAWSYSAMSGPSIKRGKTAEEALFDANFNDVDWRAKYTSMETKGIETVEGEACYKVVLTPKIGKARTRYYSVATGLLIRTDSTQESEMGTISGVTLNKDYRMVDGVLVPFQIIQEAAGQTIIMTMSEIKNNVDLPASVFEPPAAVKELIK